MNETGAYTQEMLDPFQERIAQLKEIIKRDSADGKHPEPILRLMSRKLEGVGECGIEHCCCRQFLVAANPFSLPSFHRLTSIREATQRPKGVTFCPVHRAGTHTSAARHHPKRAGGDDSGRETQPHRAESQDRGAEED